MAIPNFEDIADTISFLDDWEERYQVLIDYGKSLPAYPEKWRDEAHKVRGCASQVWLHLEWENNQLKIWGDSDAFIVKGLVAICMSFYHNSTPDDIQSKNIHAAFKSLGLAEHISAQRSNGFYSMVEHIKKFATRPASTLT